MPFLEAAFAFFFFEHSDQLRRPSLSLFLQAWCLPCAHIDIAIDPNALNTELNFRLNKGAASGQQAVPSRPLRDLQGGCLWAADQTPHQGHIPTPTCTRRQPSGRAYPGCNTPECFPIARSHLHAAQLVLKANTVA